MKLNKIFSLISLSVFYAFLTLQNAHADVIIPGQDPSTHRGNPEIERNYILYNRISSILPYVIVGLVILFAIVVSMIVLSKIRKKSVGK